MTNAITVAQTAIRQHGGLYSLNDLHKAAGNEKRHQPSDWLRLDQTRALAAEISNSGNSRSLETKTGRHGGTYVCRELVVAYAAWISAEFHLKVIRVFMEASTAPAHRPELPPQGPTPPNFTAALTRQQAIDHAEESPSQRTDRRAVYAVLAFDGAGLVEFFRDGRAKGWPEMYLRAIGRDIEKQKFGILLAEDALDRARQAIGYIEKTDAGEALAKLASALR
jgi:hypothetical protein